MKFSWLNIFAQLVCLLFINLMFSRFLWSVPSSQVVLHSCQQLTEEKGTQTELVVQGGTLGEHSSNQGVGSVHLHQKLKSGDRDGEDRCWGETSIKLPESYIKRDQIWGAVTETSHENWLVRGHHWNFCSDVCRSWQTPENAEAASGR